MRCGNRSFQVPAGVLKMNDVKITENLTLKNLSFFFLFTYYQSRIAIFAATAWAADPWPNRIPDNLALCYVNKTISDQFRRMPASIENLVALIRKVEAHPDTALWPIGKMASTLIHR